MLGINQICQINIAQQKIPKKAILDLEHGRISVLERFVFFDLGDVLFTNFTFLPKTS